MSTISQLVDKIAATANALKASVVPAFSLDGANYNVYEDKHEFTAELRMFPRSEHKIFLEVSFDRETQIKYTITTGVERVFILWIFMYEGKVKTTYIMNTYCFDELKDFITSDRVLSLPSFFNLCHQVRRYNDNMAVLIELIESVLSSFVIMYINNRFGRFYGINTIGSLEIYNVAKIVNPVDMMFVDVSLEIV